MATDLQSTRLTRSSTAFWLATTACFLWFAVGLFLLSRRFAGAFDRPLTDSALIVCGMVMVLGAALIRVGWSNPAPFGSSGRWRWILPTCAIVLTAASLSIPSANPLALVVFWMALCVAEFLSVSGALLINRGRNALDHPARADNAGSGVGLHDQSVPKIGEPKALDLAESIGSGVVDPVPQPTIEPQEFGSENATDENVIQQLTRSRDAEGNETLAGKVRLEFGPAEKHGRVHIAFSPPFPTTPEVYLEPVPCATEFEAKLAGAFPHGARIDLRLNQDAPEKVTVWLEVFAVG